MHSVLTIAGSDPTGGAGLQADLQVFHAHGVHGAGVPSALTIQDGLRIRQTLPVFPSVLLETLRSTLDTIKPAAIKIGMLATDDIVRNVVLALAPYLDVPVVIDPVLAASDGTPLLEKRAYPALRDLIHGRTLLTPNWPEAEILSNRSLSGRGEAEEAARQLLLDLELSSILLKGGHRERDADDLLVTRIGGEGRGDETLQVEWLVGERLPGDPVHGTGCALSAAIAARIALGATIRDAVIDARSFVRKAIVNATTMGNGARFLDFA